MTGPTQERIMVPPKDQERERKQAPLPIEAENVTLHYRLTQVEDKQEEILKSVAESHRKLRKAIFRGFRDCSASRPCKQQAAQSPATTPASAQPTLPAVDWQVWQKVIAGVAIIGSLLGGALVGIKKPDMPQTAISGSQGTTITAPAGK